MASDIKPMKPQENKNPKPMLKVFLVCIIMLLNTRSWEPKQTDAIRPPTISLILHTVNSSSVMKAMIIDSAPPVDTTG